MHLIIIILKNFTYNTLFFIIYLKKNVNLRYLFFNFNHSLKFFIKSYQIFWTYVI